jgi:hypothetical protein
VIFLGTDILEDSLLLLLDGTALTSSGSTNTSSGSTNTSPNIVIGAAVGGALCLMAAAGIAWAIRKRTARLLQAITGTSELVIVDDSTGLSGRVRTLRISLH